MTHGCKLWALAALIAALPLAATAQVSIRDDLNRPVFVRSKPQRIVTLAPFLTELVYAAGAGDHVIGVPKLSDFPPDARKVPHIGTGAEFSLAQLATFKPDLVLAWRDGIRKEEIERISAFGATVFAASARSLEDVPRLLKAIGLLTGNDVTAAVAEYEAKIERLKLENANKRRISAFLELWNRPLTTISGTHFMTEALDICRADNVFKDLPGSAPQITIDELYEKDPFVIVGAGSATNVDEFRSNWNVRQGLNAVKDNRLIFVDTDTFQRPTPRTPEAIAQLCVALDTVRPASARQAAPATPTTQRPSQFGM
ncbi:MAG TPA: helical backbone metal receptor [Usitatibacter sp.]|nr:helical backbone metal receptor [Usitatibacter sp.]